jgi:ParB-like chromosome segregation protein Spo0J
MTEKFYDHALIAADDLIPYAMNSRTHSDAQVAQIAASIREFGFTNPVLIDEANNLIAGHGRVLAARKLNMEVIPAIIVTGLDENRRRALVIADNKLALNAEWDEDKLLVELQSMTVDMQQLVGFSQDELVAMLQISQIDYSILDGDLEADQAADEMEAGVKRAIQIEFESEHYDEAAELVSWWRGKEAYVGGMILSFLRAEKKKA